MIIHCALDDANSTHMAKHAQRRDTQQNASIPTPIIKHGDMEKQMLQETTLRRYCKEDVFVRLQDDCGMADFDRFDLCGWTSFRN